MPQEVLTVKQVARYLHIRPEEVEKLASGGKIPSYKVRGECRFRKGDVDHYVELSLGDLNQQRLAEIEHGVATHHGIEPTESQVMALIPAGGVLAPLAARTRDAAIRQLVAAADAAELVYDKNDLVEKIRQRETLCPTTVAPGVAMPHPRYPQPYDIAASFLIVGRADSGIPFGCPDGTLTRLFFLICCKDDRTHLHVLARLGQMLTAEAIIELLEAPDASAIRAVLEQREQAVIAGIEKRQQ